MYLYIYRLLKTIIYPILVLFVIVRCYLKKEHSTKYQERFGYSDCSIPKGEVFWFHIANAEEILPTCYIVEHMKSKYKNEANAIITVKNTAIYQLITKTSINMNAIIMFSPLDASISLNRFILKWQPKHCIFFDLGVLFSLLADKAKRYNLILFHGVSKVTHNNTNYFGIHNSVLHHIISKFDLIISQSRSDKKILEELGLNNVLYLGNIRYSSPILPADATEVGKIIAMINQRPVFLAASICKGEEIILLDVYSRLKNHYEDLLMIITPIDLTRASDIKKLLTSNDLQVTLRSKNEVISNNTNIYIADQADELGIFYKISPIVFIGGTMLNNIGGHNPIEVAKLRSAIIMGSDTANYDIIVKEMQEKKACIQVLSVNDLYKNLHKLLSNPIEQENMATNAFQFIQNKSSNMETLLKVIHECN